MAAGRAWLMWGLGALCYLTALFHRMSLSVAGLTAQERFSIDATGLAAFSVVQLVLYALLQVPVGAAADRFGPRRLLALGMALMAAGSIVFALATAYPAAMAGRALIGAGDAFLFVNVLRLAHNWFPGRRYALVAALTGMIGGLGQLIATAPLAALLTGFGWTPAFLVAGVITAVLLVAVGVALRDGPSVAVREEPREPLRVSLRHAWRNRGTRHAMWTHFTLMGAFVTFTAVLGQPYLVHAQGRTPAAASALLTVVVGGFVLAGTFAGQLASRRPGVRGPMVAWAAVVSVACWAVLVVVPGPLPVAVLGPVLFLIGAAGAVSMLAFDLARSANHGHQAGVASGVANMGGFTFAVVAELGAGLLLDELLRHGVAGPLAYRLSFLVALVMGLAGTVRLLTLHKHAGVRPRELELAA
ncbi:MFS transporter [Amycolatopsis thermoflava]|uniref:Lysosomal dipeptide transporter MFSD1 n=1 Tax=Amycolatopsis thermoflava TaxID=84480 RepID=A0A3N2GU86_9PSEU|nr:MFS transporter [Amycolatopsis thermoflava]ROS40192.1 nitrate/nitrite transporter NarK [Amycolatopsis thermoflava]